MFVKFFFRTCNKRNLLQQNEYGQAIKFHSSMLQKKIHSFNGLLKCQML